MRIKLTGILVATALVAATPAHAQFGGMLNRLVPGAAPASSMSPDAYLAEAHATTQIVMVGVAVLAEASKETMEMNALQARIGEINSCQNVGELNSIQGQFNSDVEALKTNEQSSERVRSAYVAGDERRKRLLGAAAYNLLWGGLRTGLLVARTNDLVNSVRSNPMLLLKARSMVEAGQLLGRQAQAIPVILSHARIIMREEGTEEPREAEASDARVVEI